MLNKCWSRRSEIWERPTDDDVYRSKPVFTLPIESTPEMARSVIRTKVRYWIGSVQNECSQRLLSSRCHRPPGVLDYPSASDYDPIADIGDACKLSNHRLKAGRRRLDEKRSAISPAELPSEPSWLISSNARRGSDQLRAFLDTDTEARLCFRAAGGTEPFDERFNGPRFKSIERTVNLASRLAGASEAKFALARVLQRCS